MNTEELMDKYEELMEEEKTIDKGNKVFDESIYQLGKLQKSQMERFNNAKELNDLEGMKTVHEELLETGDLIKESSKNFDEFAVYAKGFKQRMHEFVKIVEEYGLTLDDLRILINERKYSSEESIFDLQKELDIFQNKLDVVESALDGMRDVQGYTVADLFNPGFLKKHTNYTDCDEFLEDSGITPDQLLNYQKYPEIANKIAKEMTDFDNFDDFVKEAVLEYNLKNHGINEIPDFVREGTDLKFKK